MCLFQYVDILAVTMCRVDMTGARCYADEDGCAESPCVAGASCIDLKPAEAKKQGRGYRCSNCPDGYHLDNGLCVGEDALFV